MKKWIKNNLRNIIVFAFIIPILLVAFVSISHVTSFYGISNPWTWALYLSVGIEIAALSALAAVSVKMGRFIYIPFLIVTLIQMIGNIFFSFSYIDENSEIFKDWVSMVGGLFENMGVEPNDIASHKFILSFLTGGLLPIISLTFAHMLVKYSEQNQVEGEISNKNYEINIEEYEKLKNQTIGEKIKKDDELRYKPTEEELEKLDNILKNIKHEDTRTETSDNGKKITKNEVIAEKNNQDSYKNKVIAEKNNQDSYKNEVIVEKIKPKSYENYIVGYNDDIRNKEYDFSKIEKLIGKEITNDFIQDEPVTKPQIEITLKKEDTPLEVLDEPKKNEVAEIPIETIEQPEIIEEIKLEEEPQIQEDEEIQEVKPEPIDESPKYKVLNYFKKSD